MNTWWTAALGIGGGVLVLWVALVATLYVVGRRGGLPVSTAEAMRLLPDVVRLVRRLAGDRSLPRRVRWSLWGLLAYLLLPVDLVPDFIPVAGQADDVLLVALVLRATLKAAGPDALQRHWPGTPTGLEVVRRLSGPGAPRSG
jgi:uncharacterized membrane protein YkvA (DUF1232 family)